jgi:uncharacterized protein YjbI with pentapeptide repeats
MDGLVLRMVTTVQLSIEQCQLPAAHLYGADLRNATILDSDLSGANISNVRLSGARLHGSDLTDAVGGASLRDLQIDVGQVFPVAMLALEGLGISITDRPAT